MDDKRKKNDEERERKSNRQNETNFAGWLVDRVKK
jgi:hypothetical protein